MASIAVILHRWRDFWGDAFRLPVALVVWNFRKSSHRRRGGHGHCPCQHPSDSGRAFATHCEAALHWNQAARFRVVCPLLKPGPSGYLCSVDTRDVRPFWGRALAIYASALLIAGLGAATTGYVALQQLGNHEVTWLDVAWPPHWGNIARARARAFCARAIAAIAAHDYARARLSLESAVVIDPQNYEAAMLLAMLQSLSTTPGVADSAFQWLINQHPTQAVRSAITYHDMLLASGRPAQLASFATWMARHDPASKAFWVRALLVSLHATGQAAAFAKANAAELAQLDPPARALIATEILAQQNQAFTARLALQRPVDAGGSPVYGLLQIEQLLRLADVPAAVNIKNSLAPALDPFLILALQFWFERQANNTAAARASFARLVEQELSMDKVDWLMAMLVRAPDQECFARLDEKLRARRPDGPVAALGGGMWTLALVCGERPAADYWAEFLRSHTLIVVPPAGDIDFHSLTLASVRSVPALLSILPLPRETGYALYSRVHVYHTVPQ